MKFSDGLWQKRPGYRIQHPNVILEYDLTEDSIHLYALCHPLDRPDDLTGGTSLEYTFSSPREDMIRVHVTHYAGTVRRGPCFSLNTEEHAGKASETESQLILKSGRTSVVIEKSGGFAYTFLYDGRRLTGADGLTSYVTDADYEADRVADYNRRALPRGYEKRTWLREYMQLDVGETVYGLGEHFTPLVRNGQSLDVWNRDGGSNTDQGYKCVPFYLSSRGYGVLVNTPDLVDYEIGTESVRHVIFTVEDEELEYIVIGAEEPKKVLSAYTALTGRSPVPPAWSFGLWLSTSWLPELGREELLSAIDRMAECGIPLSVFHFDARWMLDFHDCDFRFHPRYGDARRMLREIHDRGVRVCCWINPYVSQPSYLFREGLEHGYFVRRPDGSVWQTDEWMTGMAIVDFTNPAASAWYTRRLAEVIDLGVDCVKTDFGERIPTDVVWFDGSDPRRMHNYYTYLYNKAVFGMLKEKLGERNAVVFARSSTVGTQCFPVNWGGDNQASYVSMAETLRGGLSFCQSGFGFWAHDISGFMGTATPDLYKRWCAFGLLSTHSRLHGHSSFRMPWFFGEESCEVLRAFTRLKCSLMPYIFEGAVNVWLSGQPEMRAMMLDFPDDPVCAYLDRQYMLGERLLVAPVFNDRGEAQFYLPAGRWTDWFTGEVLEGGRYVRRVCDYFSLPLLARENSLIALGSRDDRPDYDYDDGTVYRLFELKDRAECRVYGQDCSERVHAAAVLEDGVIRFAAEGPGADKPWKLQLVNVHAAAVTGGSAVDDPLGMIVTPEPGAHCLTVRLRQD